MKKIIFLLAAVTLFAVACDKNDDGKGTDDTDPVGAEYETYAGTLTVDQNDGTIFTKESVTITVAFDGEGKAVVKMLQVKFSDKMPMTLDMTIPGITAVETADGVELSGDGIVPEAMGGPFSAYTITELEGTVTPSAISFEMMCGDFPTSFSGTAAGAED